MSNFTEFDKVKFELTDVVMWGVAKNKKYGRFTIPVTLDTETINKIHDLAEKHRTKDPMYKNTVYLKTKRLSEKQTRELLSKGRCHVNVHFEITGVYTNDNNTRYLSTKVTKLSKVEKPESDIDA